MLTSKNTIGALDLTRLARAMFMCLCFSSGLLSQTKTTANLVLGTEVLFPKRLNVTLSLSEDSVFFDFIDDERYLQNLHLSLAQIDSIHDILGAYSLFYIKNRKAPLKFGITRESQTLENISYKLRSSKHREKAKVKRKNGNAAIVLFPVHAFMVIPTTIEGNMQFVSDSTFAFTPTTDNEGFTKTLYFDAHRVLFVRSFPFKILTVISEKGVKYNFRVKDKGVKQQIRRTNERYNL